MIDVGCRAMPDKCMFTLHRSQGSRSVVIQTLLSVTMYAQRQMAYKDRMRLDKQEWRVMHRLETREDLLDLLETWDRIIASISGSRPPSDEDVP